MALFTDKAKDVIFDALQCFFQGHPLFPWNDNDKETMVMIVDKYTVNLKSVAVENLPAIIVNRGTMSWRQRTIDQRADGHGAGASQPSRFADVIDTRFRIDCISKKGLEAEILASYVFGLFTFFKDILRKSRTVHDIRSANLGVERIGRSDSDIEISVVPVEVSLTLNQTWASEETGAPLLSSICLNPSIFSVALENAKQWNRFQRTLIST